ncbi:MAG: hypothetical protein ACO1PN_12770 [Betaproteobacteria bacterium]
MNKPVQLIMIVSALTVLGGCVAVPVQPGYYEPAPVVYVPAPAYYGPSVSFGFYGGGGGGGHRHYRGGRHGGHRGHH